MLAARKLSGWAYNHVYHQHGMYLGVEFTQGDDSEIEKARLIAVKHTRFSVVSMLSLSTYSLRE